MVISHPHSSEAVITNTDFLSELARPAPEGSCLWVNRFHGDPNSEKAKWGGLVYTPDDHARGMCDEWGDFNTYVSVAAVKIGADGLFHRRKSTFARMLALVVDDVELQSLYSSPSWVLETSPGNTQAGFLLDADDPDCADEALCSAVVKSMATAGSIGDISGNNSVRYVRLPIGTNQKPRMTGDFEHRLLQWRPTIRLSLEDACAAVGLDLNLLRNHSIHTRGVAPSLIQPGASQENKLQVAVAAVMQGHFHEPLNIIAASLISTGAHPAAVTNMLRGLMQAFPGSHDERWESRFKDIPRCVFGAEEKFKPAPTSTLMARNIGNGEVQPNREQLFTKVSVLLGDLKPVQWLIEGYLETDALSMVFGPSGGGKSFCVVDMACCVATGIPWHGMPVKKGAVFYIAGEGHNGLSRRFGAWQKARGVQLDDAVPLFKSNRAVMILDEESAQWLADEVARLVKLTGFEPQLVIVDTLARNFGEGDENTQKDAGRFIDHLDRFIRRPYKCNVMTVHHSGHSQDRARGSSAFKAAMDQEIWVKGSMGLIDLKVTKMKDAEIPAARRFKIAQTGLGIMDDCDIEITGAYLDVDGNPLDFVVGKRTNGGDLTAIDVAKAIYPKWPGVPPIVATLGCSDRSLSRIMGTMRDQGLVTKMTGAKGWELTDRAIDELSMTGHLINGGSAS